ncbi:MAG: methylated-DNA--[protein]-cysteine S-methyltransferase [Comamonadaceae bacterium]|nr:MAG: methylated-DNA--[protein]-cysteine S-methyltransferase [Comamonadaceae bacterium]
MKFSAIPIHRHTVASPLGTITLAATGHGLAGLWFEAQRHAPDMRGWIDAPEHTLLRQAKRQLDAYFAGATDGFDLPLDLSHGTAFQQSVWRGLLGIARGRTESYGALAARIGSAAAVRAVGAAVGRNPISLIVPCHRVLGGRGELTGYAGGLQRKVALLTIEGALWRTAGPDRTDAVPAHRPPAETRWHETVPAPPPEPATRPARGGRATDAEAAGAGRAELHRTGAGTVR